MGSAVFARHEPIYQGKKSIDYEARADKFDKKKLLMGNTVALLEIWSHSQQFLLSESKQSEYIPVHCTWKGIS